MSTYGLSQSSKDYIEKFITPNSNNIVLPQTRTLFICTDTISCNDAVVAIARKLFSSTGEIVSDDWISDVKTDYTAKRAQASEFVLPSAEKDKCKGPDSEFQKAQDELKVPLSTTALLCNWLDNRCGALTEEGKTYHNDKCHNKSKANYFQSLDSEIGNYSKTLCLSSDLSYDDFANKENAVRLNDLNAKFEQIANYCYGSAYIFLNRILMEIEKIEYGVEHGTLASAMQISSNPPKFAPRFDYTHDLANIISNAHGFQEYQLTNQQFPLTASLQLLTISLSL